MKKLVTHLLIGCALFSVAALGFGVGSGVAYAQETGNPTGFIGSETIFSVLWAFVNNTFGTFVYLFGSLLDTVVDELILNFGQRYIDETGFVVEELWSIVRDLFNIGFIFGLVYLGFTMILKNDDTSTRRWLVSLILAALLVNFSLFITKFIVDFSNVLAAEIVQNGFVPPSGSDRSISATFMNSLGLTSVFDGAWINDAPFTAGSYAGAFGLIFGAMVLFIVTAFVFAAGAIMIIIRFVALNLYMVLSPLMFLGWVFPQLQDVSRKYWRGFLGRAFFAPIYMLLLYFAAYVMSAFRTDYQGDFSSLLSGSASENTAGIAINVTNALMPYAITIGFLIAAVVVANKMGADGAGKAVSMMDGAWKNVQRRANRAGAGAGRLAWQGATAAPRAGVRRSAYGAGRLLDSSINRLQRSNDPLGRSISRGTIGRTIQQGAQNLQRTKAGFSTTVEEQRQQRAKVDREANQYMDIRRGAAALRENAEYDRANQAIHPTSGEIVDRASLSPDELRAVERLEQQRDNQIAAMQSAVVSLSAKELERFMKDMPGIFSQVVGYAKAGNVEKMLESDTLDDAQKSRLLQTYRNAVEETLFDNGVALSNAFAALSEKQIELLGDEFRRENVHHFTSSQMENIKKSDAYTADQKESYRTTRRSRQEAAIRSADANTRDRLFRNTTGAVAASDLRSGETVQIANLGSAKKATEIAQLPASVLVTREAVPYITGSVLEEIYNKKSLSVAERAQLRDLILNNQAQADRSAITYLSTPRAIQNWGGQSPASDQSRAANNAPSGDTGTSSVLGPDGRPLPR
ncbi:MAG: hypothetical protein ACOC4E_00905 [Patescibacteria group bacterium]